MTGPELYSQISAYLGRTGTLATDFGPAIGSDAAFVGRLRYTASPRPATVERALRVLAEHPDGIGLRPGKAKAGRFRIGRETLEALRPHASKRGLEVQQLAVRIVEMVARDGMVDAVLDDG